MKKTGYLPLEREQKMATKTTFIWYYDWIDYADVMTDAELWMLFRKILQHVNDEEEIEIPLELKLVWVWIKKKLDEQKEKWEKKVETIKQQNSEKGKNHTWNQYTKWDEKRKDNNKAQKNTVEQMEQNGTNGTNGTMSWYTNTISSSSKKEEKNRRKEEMLEAFRHDPRLTPYMEESEVRRWLDYREEIKKPYQDVKSFITAMVKVKNNIAKGKPKSDQNRRNRFSFLVSTAIWEKWEWLRWYDSVEQDYLDSKDDLYPTPKQNE